MKIKFADTVGMDLLVIIDTQTGEFTIMGDDDFVTDAELEKMADGIAPTGWEKV